jgi:AraC-like DNA-binding protein/quercetin dioxygenase-like cupin family protein
MNDSIDKDEEPTREKKNLRRSFPFLLTEIPLYEGFPPHWHDCFEMLYMRSGGMFASIDGVMNEALPGDVVLVNGGSVHGFLGARPGTSLTIIQFKITFFDDNFLTVRDSIFNQQLVSRRMLEAWEKVHPPKPGRALWPLIDRIFNGMSRDCRERLPGWELSVKSRMYALMTFFLRDTAEINNTAEQRPAVCREAAGDEMSNYTIRQLQAFVFKNFADPELDLDRAADKSGYSKFYFERFFKKYTGQSFHNYLNQTRIHYAREYLTETEQSVTDIAFRCGFDSLQTFNRVFKNTVGRTPSVYRAETNTRHQSSLVDQHFDSNI